VPGVIVVWISALIVTCWTFSNMGLGMVNDPSPPTDTADDNTPALLLIQPTKKSLPTTTNYIPSNISKQEQEVIGDGGQMSKRIEKTVTPSVRPENSIQQDDITGVYPMANNRSFNVPPAFVPALLPPQEREPNRGEGYRVRPFYLCMDVSGSMTAKIKGERAVMDEVNDELAELLTSLKKQPEVCDVTRFSIVSFASDAKVELPLANLQTIRAMPVLKADSGTSFTRLACFAK
jgi:hypothetical protein